MWLLPQLAVVAAAGTAGRCLEWRTEAGCTGDGAGLDVDAVERVGAELILRIDLHHHEVLVERGVHGGDLALAEGVVEDLVDGGGGDAEARGGVAIDDQGCGQALVLLVGGDVAQLGHGAHAREQLRRPGVQLVQVFVGERVLILRGAAAAADLDVLLGLQEERGAGNAGELCGAGRLTTCRRRRGRGAR